MGIGTSATGFFSLVQTMKSDRKAVPMFQARIYKTPADVTGGRKNVKTGVFFFDECIKIIIVCRPIILLSWVTHSRFSFCERTSGTSEKGA
jgi:hypothetical protein